MLIGLFLPTKKLPHLLFRLRSLVSYLWYGQSRYHVHSDFVFNYINQVLRDRKKQPVWERIEAIRQELKTDLTPIAPQPLGAKASSAQSNTASKKVKQTATPETYGRLLSRTVAYFGAKNVLELGTGMGISTLYLGSNAVVNKLVSLEGNPALIEIAQKQAKQMGLNNIEFVVGDFDSTLSTSLGKLGSVDLAFIDGNHQKGATLRYYNQILPYTHNDSVLIFDDINWSPEMQEAWQEIIARPEVTLSLDFYRMGMVFFRKEIRQPQHIRLYYW